MFKNTNKNKEKYLRNIFSKYIEPEKINSILNNPNNILNNLNEKEVDFIIIKIDEKKLIKNLKLFSSAIEIVLPSGCVDIVANLIFVYLNIPMKISNDSKTRIQLVDELLNKLNDSISLAHGNKKCRYGSYGSEKRMNYGVLIPEISNIIAKLDKLPNGKAIEINN